MSRYIKDPDAVLDYKVDFTKWLQSGETITVRTVTADSGLTVDSSSITDSGKSVTAWLSGGTVPNEYKIVFHVETDSTPARKDDRTIYIKLLNK